MSNKIYACVNVCDCRDGPSWSKLSEAQKRVVELELRDFVLGGVSLEGEAKERYNAIQQDLAQLSTKFSNNVLDATKVCVVFGWVEGAFWVFQGV
jgi:Zn-dependent oligopeptidase